MTIIRGHIIELNPNNKQATYFNKACGVARLSYNWALAEWQKQYQADKDYRDECQKLGIMVDESKLNKPTQGKLRKQLNAIKREQIPLYARSYQMLSHNLPSCNSETHLNAFLKVKATTHNLEKKA